MAYNLKEVMAQKPSRFTAGHRMCAGCGAPPVARMVLRALKPTDHAVIANATGCMEVSTCLYPYSAWTDSYIHTAFECAGATCSGVEAAYRSLVKQGKLVEKDGEQKEYTDYDITKVYLSEITPSEIKEWIDSGEAMDKAGAYAIQGQFSKFITKFEGSYNSVVGLPVQKLYQIIKGYLD